ncbi:MAG TPA: NAD-dependent epimerase/dehydratase family protein [Balneolaceae bacterium]|nr:NAD-dependent epimerase/dehydratase family protein [Balneolaceae bacterium]
MQTILGAGGAIGTELAKALTEYTDHIRLASRSPKKVNPSDELFAADLLDSNALHKAVRNAKVVYVTIGFAYNYKVWKNNWPPFIKNVIKSCKKEECKLVFFDNVYMYDPDFLNKMTETTPVNPPSKKGKIRAEIASMIMDEAKSGSLQAVIARSADFYGPSIKGSSILTEMVCKPLSQGKKANWLGEADCKHSYTYTPDAAKATALLGNNEKAYGSIWHLPTASNPPTGKEWIKKIAQELHTEPKFRSVPKFIVRMMGLFNSVMRESVEMMYQYEQDYIFSSRKIEKEFGIEPTPYETGIQEVIGADYKKESEY